MLPDIKLGVNCKMHRNDILKARRAKNETPHSMCESYLKEKTREVVHGRGRWTPDPGSVAPELVAGGETLNDPALPTLDETVGFVELGRVQRKPKACGIG